ncbi:MAG: dTMP kinase [Firmicutes bacterium]|nr:dTMP kinase [Bacillota bacterium]
MFITLEGPEGSGKTSVMKEVIARLRKEGFVIEETREPGGTPIAEQIRQVILQKENTKLDSRAEALLLAASRRQNLVEKIWPALKAGKIVICDRFIDSSLAYQGGARGLGIEAVLSINLFATESSYPQLTLLFDIPPELGLKRIAANANREINRLDLEQLSFHQKVRDTYLQLAKRFKDRFVIIDASLPLQTVIENTYQAIHNRLL